VIPLLVANITRTTQKDHIMTTIPQARVHNEESTNRQVASRRGFLATATAAAIAATTSRVLGRDYGPQAQPVRYPEPDVVVLNPKLFEKYKIGNSPILRLHTGMLWAEGTAWNSVGKYLVWSDIPNDVQLRWLNDDGHVSVMRNPAYNSNGNTFDYSGRQISCEHGTHSISRYEHNGQRNVLADSFQGKPLNAPNDPVVHPDGGIWFTDPGYGSLLNYEGNRATGPSVQPYQKEAVFRIDPQSNKLEKMTDEIFKPNGLCFSPDYTKLYVADTGASHYPDAPKNIKVWEVVDGKKLTKGKEFCSMKLDGFDKAGLADGIRADNDGNVWASAGWVGYGYDGVHIFAPNGERIGQIRLPEICGNLCFGGPKRNRLFMAGSQSLYAVYVETQGAHIC